MTEKVNFYDHISASKRNSVLLVLIVLSAIVFLGYIMGLIFGDVFAGVIIAVSIAFFLILLFAFQRQE